jgi:glutaconyl-CoA/methylmalonyl-CoA decarboxylase subunit gamma
MKKFKVKVNNKSYDVEVEEVKSGASSDLAFGEKKPAPVMASIKKAGTTKGKITAGSFTIKAPLPGLIVEIAVETGKVVKQGEKILILEAMKMENAILAPISGTIDKIDVKVGDSVNGNQKMIVIKA